MNKYRKTQKTRLKDVEILTKTLTHQYFTGQVDQWFASLHKDCVWVGSGEPTLYGAENIRTHFDNYKELPNTMIVYEAYVPISLSSTSFLVNAQVTLGPDKETPTILCQLTLAYRFAGTEPKIVYQHMSYSFIGTGDSKSSTKSHNDVMLHSLNRNSRLFIHQLLMSKPWRKPIAVVAGNQTYFVNPNTIIYLQSEGHSTNLYCIDKTIRSSLSISEISPLLPHQFYSVRRGCIINAIYVTAIRRCEVELIFSVVVKIPVPNYVTVKKELQELIIKQ